MHRITLLGSVLLSVYAILFVLVYVTFNIFDHLLTEKRVRATLLDNANYLKNHPIPITNVRRANEDTPKRVHA